MTARGWTVAVDAGVFPTELRVGRTRIGEDGDAPVFFTATLTNWAGEAARRVSISVGLSEGKSLAELLALGVTNLVPVRAALDDADFDPDGMLQGVPYLIYAATLGYAGVVSVLITAGADPGVPAQRVRIERVEREALHGGPPIDLHHPSTEVGGYASFRGRGVGSVDGFLRGPRSI